MGGEEGWRDPPGGGSGLEEGWGGRRAGRVAQPAGIATHTRALARSGHEGGEIYARVMYLGVRLGSELGLGSGGRP